MKKILFIITLLLITFTAKAQTWNGSVSHNGYSCHSFQTAEGITVYASKGVAGYMGTALYIKIKVPYNWGNTGTGHVKYFKKNLITGATDTQSSFFNYRNGWLYFIEYLTDWCSTNDKRGAYSCNTYTITLYEKNDHGRNEGKKIVINTNLDKLNTTQMPMNEQAFETYW